MKKCFLLLVLLTVMATGLQAQYAKRQDAIWARSIGNQTITLDGVLNEPVWAQAESLMISYHKDHLLPTSGSRAEFQPFAITDSIHATVKFLSQGNKLYLGFIIPDKSIGGTKDWSRWDAILMSVLDAKSPNRPAPPTEFFYSWWLGGLQDTGTAWVGRPPRFIGKYGNWDAVTRTPAQIAVWNAVTKVLGVANDNLPDQGWNTEMVISVDTLGYDLTKPEGGMVLLNIGIWDSDNVFDPDPNVTNSHRAWWQNMWGNNYGGNEGRILARPDVTVNSATLPEYAPDVIVPNNAPLAAPAIDGNLNDTSWSGAASFNIAWGDSLTRASYSGAGKYLSGQWQPQLDGNPTAMVVDPGVANVKMFFQDNYLYLAADVNDQLVQGTESTDRMDAFTFIIGDRGAKDPDEEVMMFRELTVMFGADGQPKATGYLPGLVDSLAAEYKVALKGTTTVNVNDDVDEGYRIEMKVDLTKLGYPAGLGDKLLFMGAVLYDGDSFDDPLKNYGTKTWWYTEGPRRQGVAWMVMDPNYTTGVDDNKIAVLPKSIELLGNYPNPFNPSTKVRFALPEAGNLNISVFNVLGQKVSEVSKAVLAAGTYEHSFNFTNMTSGIYFYRVNLQSVNGQKYTSSVGKMTLVK